LSWDGPWSTLCTGEIGGDSMTRMSVVERRALESLRAAEEDASSGPALASRALLILQEAIGFDEGYILAVDPDSLLFTRLLAYRGERFARFAYWLRDGYLLERAAFPDIAFPALLRDFGGIIVLHERVDRWIGNVPRPASEEVWAHMWRSAGSPPGGGFRVGLPDRGRWIAAIQAGSWRPGDGFQPHHVDLLRRAAPGLGRALRVRLEPSERTTTNKVDRPPDAGHLLFGPDRHLAYVDSPGERWIDRLPEDGLRAHGMNVPVAAQSLVNHLVSDPTSEASSRLVDRHGFGVLARATRAGPVGGADGQVRDWVHVTIRADPVASRLAAGSLTGRQREVGLAVARGLTDRTVATDLGISVATVHDHVGALHAAYGTGTRAELVAALSSG